MKIFLTILTVLIVGLLWESYFYPSGTWRYKVTVEVETPEGIKTGSAVREVYMNAMPKILPEGASKIVKNSGEAVIVDLGERGVLFSLLNGGNPVIEFKRAIPYRKKYNHKSRSRDLINYYKNLYDKIGDKKFIITEPENFPEMMVTFTDLNDPLSVKMVHRAGSNTHGAGARLIVKEDNVEEVFGENVKIKSVTYQMTEEKVNCGIIDNFMPADYKETIVDGWRNLKLKDRKRMSGMTNFKAGECR